MITKTFTSGAGFEAAQKLAFSIGEEKIAASFSKGKASTQIIVLNTIDRLLLAKSAPVAADIVSDIMRTQERKVAQYGETAYGFSEKQSAVIARDIISRRSSII